MNTAKISDATAWFEVLQTCEKSQTAVMTLKPGGASGPSPDAHEKSEQVLLVLEGEVEAEVAGEKRRLKQGDIVVIPAGTKHRFQNRSDGDAVTFNVYSPPEYPPATKG
ncbi:MAG TPA: cupin domain-containing protein [Chthoniobacterales bacterium]